MTFPFELNQVIVGDSRLLARDIPDGSIDLIVTDPPYNVGKDYGEGGEDNLPPVEYLEWYEWICQESYRVMTNGYLYVSCTMNQIWTLRPLWEKAGFTFQIMLIWHGPNNAGGSAYSYQWQLLYEPILMFAKGPRIPMLNKVWGYKTDAILTYTRPQRNFSGELERVHICQKPMGLYRNIIARTPGQLVLDWFAGSGSVAMAARSLGRDYLTFEIDPVSAEAARKRISQVQPFFTVIEEEEPIQLDLLQEPL